MLAPLYNYRDSKIWYSSFGVGKDIGNKIYFHTSYHTDIVPKEIWNLATDLLSSIGLDIADFSVTIYSKSGKMIQFVTCPTFNCLDEPVVGLIVSIDLYTEEITTRKCDQIYHHKWLFVKSDYTGFDVQEAYERSRMYLSRLQVTPSGSYRVWQQQLTFVY